VRLKSFRLLVALAHGLLIESIGLLREAHLDAMLGLRLGDGIVVIRRHCRRGLASDVERSRPVLPRG
jgi:hypothetical protein